MKEPNYTCPIIDHAQADTEDLEEDISVVVQRWCKSHQHELEKVREANSELRRWGQHWESEAESLQIELDTARDLIDQLQEQIEELLGRVKELESELTQSEETLS